MPNFCEDNWDADEFNPYADYTIYENVPWDDFETNGYPDKKLLLLQAGRIHVRTQDDEFFVFLPILDVSSLSILATPRTLDHGQP